MTLPFSSEYFNGTAGLTQGGWIFRPPSFVSASAMAVDMLYGGGQWGAPSGQGPRRGQRRADLWAVFATEWPARDRVPTAVL